MSLKINFLHAHLHLDFFPENLGAERVEYGERFQQQMKFMETRYQGFWNETMMSDYCWFLIPKTKSNYKRQKTLI